MGYDIYYQEDTLLIRPEKLADALAAANRWREGALENNLWSVQTTPYVDLSEAFDDALGLSGAVLESGCHGDWAEEHWGCFGLVNECGDELRHCWDWAEEFLEAVAPFVDGHCYLECEGEDDALWRYYILDGHCHEVEARVVWDEPAGWATPAIETPTAA